MESVWYSYESTASTFNFLNLQIILQADYKHWLVAEIGLPPLEEWKENMLKQCFKNFVEMNEKYRDEWDDTYWDAIIHGAPASEK